MKGSNEILKFPYEILNWLIKKKLCVIEGASLGGSYEWERNRKINVCIVCTNI